MTNPVASFQTLPAELVEQILELAVQSRRHDLHDFQPTGNASGQKFARQTLFAPVQISSQSRRFALSYPPIWRWLAESITELARSGKSSSKQSLQYCIGLGGDNLSDVNLTQAGNIDRCPDRRDSAVAIIARSVASLKQIRLTVDGWRQLAQCGCHPHQIWRLDYDQYGVYIGSQPISECWSTLDDALLDIVCRSTALQRLSLNLEGVGVWNQAVETKRATADMMLARPEVLEITDQDHLRRPTAQLVSVIAQLANKARLIDYSAPRRPRDGNSPDILLHSLMRQSASSLREIWVDGHEEEFDVRTLLQQSFPNLAKISIRLWHQLESPSRRRANVKCLLPALAELESPGWIIDHIEAPQLRALTIRDIESDNEESILVDNLKHHVDVEDLVLHCKSRHGAPEISKLLQQVLRALRPVPIRPCPCPSLRRLSVLYTSCISKSKWVAQEAFLKPQEVDDSKRRGAWGNSVPYIGSDLVQLDKKRFDCSAGPNARCRPLHTISVLDCIVDPSAWESLLQTSHCVNKWYYASAAVRESREYHEKEPQKWLLPPLADLEV